MADVKTLAAPSKEVYNEIAKIAEQSHAEWLQMFTKAKTPETMAQAWSFTFNRMKDRQALQLAVASLRYGYVSAIFDLIDAFVACDTYGVFDIAQLQRKYWIDSAATEEEQARAMETLDPFRTAATLIRELGDPRLVGTYLVGNPRLPLADTQKRNEIYKMMRTCFIQFVSDLFADKYSAQGIRNSLRIFYDLSRDPWLAEYATLSGSSADKLIYSLDDVLQSARANEFAIKLQGCLRRAIGQTPNWDLLGLQPAMNLTSRVNKFPIDAMKNALLYVKDVPEIYTTVEKCLFPELYGPMPPSFFNNYVLDERTGNYIPYYQANASTSPLKKPVPVAAMTDVKDFKAAGPIQPASPSLSAAAAPSPSFSPAAMPRTIFETALSAKKSGGSTMWLPSRIPLLF